MTTSAENLVAMSSTAWANTQCDQSIFLLVMVGCAIGTTVTSVLGIAVLLFLIKRRSSSRLKGSLSLRRSRMISSCNSLAAGKARSNPSVPKSPSAVKCFSTKEQPLRYQMIFEIGSKPENKSNPATVCGTVGWKNHQDSSRGTSFAKTVLPVKICLQDTNAGAKAEVLHLSINREENLESSKGDEQA